MADERIRGEGTGAGQPRPEAGASAGWAQPSIPVPRHWPDAPAGPAAAQQRELVDQVLPALYLHPEGGKRTSTASFQASLPEGKPMVPLETLKAVRWLQGIADDQLQQVASVAEVQEFPANAVVFREGQTSSSLYLVAEGSVSLEINVPGGGSVRFQTVGPGELLGWSPLLDVGPLTATARTLAPSRLIAIDAAQVQALCAHDTGFGYEFIRRVAQVLSRRLDATRRQLELTSEERALLVRLLDTEFRDTHVELRRTSSTDFRQEVKKEEGLLRGLLDKLRTVRRGRGWG
jgi:CRP-like cAMP-binding protein